MLLHNGVLDLVDELSLETMQEAVNNKIELAMLNDRMAVFLSDSLGLSGHIDCSEEGMAKMIALYRAMAKEDLLKSDYHDIFTVEEFDKYIEKYNKQVELLKANIEKYSSLGQRLDEAKLTLQQYFKSE